MFLLIDAGNTRIKLGLHDGLTWRQREALAHDALHTCHWLNFALGSAGLQGVVVSNVAGAKLEQHLRALLGPVLARTEWLRSSAQRCGVHNDYAKPEQLGCDRWAAAIGAWTLRRAPCLVVNAGTASTLDVLSHEGHFAGGCILPGVDMMRASLAGGTAALPLAQGQFVPLPRNTDDAIVSGCLNAQLGAIAQMRALLPADSALVLTGGAAPQLLPALTAPLWYEPWLVLEGLLSIARDA